MRTNITLLVGIILLFAACTPQSKPGQSGLPGTADGVIAGDGSGRINNQERDLREAVAGSKAATVQREDNLLIVSLKADAGFPPDAAVIKQDIHPELDRIGQVLGNYPQTKIRVEGHSDNVGTDSYNMDISYRRALAVGNALVERGIEAGRIQVLAFGRAQPIASNDTEDGRQMNRRVEIKVEPFPES